MELLIRVNPKVPLVSTLSESASQRGDVIAAAKDGWKWSDAERSNPDWIIVKSNISKAQVATLMEGGREGEPKWFRRIGINVDGLATGAALTPKEFMARAF